MERVLTVRYGGNHSNRSDGSPHEEICEDEMISQPCRVGVKSREAPVGFANNRIIESNQF